MSISDDLLEPTLSNEKQRVAIFSARACFFTAFLGGPIAISLLSGVNSWKLNRLKKDLFYYLLGCAVFFVYFFIVLDIPEGVDAKEIIALRRENIFYRYGTRGLGLVLWAGYYFLNKPYYKIMDIFEISPPNPWKTAIICVLAGGVCQFLAGMLIITLKGGI